MTENWVKFPVFLFCFVFFFSPDGLPQYNISCFYNCLNLCASATTEHKACLLDSEECTFLCRNVRWCTLLKAFNIPVCSRISSLYVLQNQLICCLLNNKNHWKNRWVWRKYYNKRTDAVFFFFIKKSFLVFVPPKGCHKAWNTLWI